MKKINFTNPGGIDFTCDDLMFIYEALREGLEGALSWLKPYNNVIIHGCVITEVSGDYTYTEGWMYHDGSFYYVPALTTPTEIDLANYVWEFEEDDIIPEGTQTCEDTSTANTWLRSIASIVRSAGATNLYLATNTMRAVFAQILANPAWVNPAFQHDWAGTFQYRINWDGEVEFIGIATHVAIAGGQEHIEHLPAAYWPTEEKQFAVAGHDGTKDDMVIVKVSTNGEVEVVTGYGINRKVVMNSIRYRK